MTFRLSFPTSGMGPTSSVKVYFFKTVKNIDYTRKPVAKTKSTH